MANSLLVYGSEVQAYNFGPEHPFSPIRGAMLTELLADLGALDSVIKPVCASRNQILTMHSEAYVAMVEAASSNGPVPNGAMRYGLDTGDVPVFEGMHKATAWIVGGTLTAARLVAEGKARRALHLAGGLHHAHRNRASGFCVYNDASIAIGALLDADFKRIVYVDIDVHHGDGVQSHFYEDPRVLTISLHESGEYLYPGTGFTGEIGRGTGQGYAANFPLAPFTGPDSYLNVFDECVEPLVAAFKPEVMVVECGVDAHALDPLAHLNLNSHTFLELFIRICDLADKCCDGQAVIHLGGGYNLDVTPRMWAMLALVVQGMDIPERLPGSWLYAWQGRLQHSLTQTMHDHRDMQTSENSTSDLNYRTAMKTMENLSRYWL